MSVQEVKQVLKFRLEHSKDNQEIVDLANQFLGKEEPELLYDLCRFGFRKLEEDFAAERENRRRLKEIAVLKSKPLLLNPDQKKMLDIEENVYSTLPNYLRLSPEANHNLRYKFAETMVKGAINNKNNTISRLKKEGKKEIDDETLDKVVVKVVEEATRFVTAPSQHLQLCRVLDQATYPNLGLPIAEYAHKSVLDIRAQFRKRVELSTRIDMWEAEIARLKPIKKELTKKQLEELTELKKQLADFEMPFTDSMAALDVNAYEQMVLQVAITMIACAVNFKKNLMEKKKLVIQKKETFTKKEKFYVDDAQQLDDLVKKVISWAFQPGRVEDPNHMLQIAKNITDPDIQTAFSIGQAIIDRLKQLKTLYEKRLADKKEYDQLKEERDKVYATWKLLPEEKQKILTEKEFQYLTTTAMSPAYMVITKDKYEQLELQVAKFLLDCIFDRRDRFADFVKNPNKYPNEKRLSTDQITEEYKKFAESVKLVFESIEDPVQLHHIAVHIQGRKDSPNVRAVGEKVQKVITRIEAQREIRAPLQAELNSLQATKTDLLSRNRPFEKEKQDRLDALKKQIDDLPNWPEYAELFNHHQYDNLSLDIVRTMTIAILDNKTALEEEIARMFKETAPEDIDHNKIEQDRTSIQSSIRELTKQCLTKFSNPTYLMKFAKDMQSRKETEIVLEVVKKLLERIQEINEQRRIRKPIQLKIDELELAQEEAQKTGKTFNKKDELLDLKNQIEKLPVYPHFSQVYKDNEYTPTLFSGVELALVSVLDERDVHEVQISKQFYEDRTRVDHAKIAQERKAKEANIEFVMSAATTHVSDFANIQSLIQTLCNRKESSLAIRLTNYCFELLKKLQTHRKKKIELQHNIDILTEEEKFLASRKKPLDDQAKEKLANFKKKMEALNAIKTFPDLSTEAKDLKMKDDLVVLLVNTVFDKKSTIFKNVRNDKDMTDERKQYWASYVVNSEKEIGKLIFENVETPSVLLSVSKTLRSLNEFDYSAKVGEHCLNILSKIRKVQEKQEKIEKERLLLVHEEEQLHKVMRYLPLDKKQALRKLQLRDRLFKEKAAHYQKQFEPDSFALELSQHLIISSLDAQTFVAPEIPLSLPSLSFLDLDIDIDMEDEELEPLTDETKEGKKASFSTEAAHKTDTIIKLCLRHVFKITNLITLARLLTDKHQYHHVIRAGKKCQLQITKRKNEFEKHDEIRKNFEELDNLRLQYLFQNKPEEIDPEERASLERKLGEAREEMEKLPDMGDVNAEIATLDTQMLEVTELIIVAAKIENFENELKTQTIKAFKFNTTVDRWDQVRQLIPEEEWDKVKEELVVYVLKQTGNVRDKIDLLTKDGLYKQVIEVFPKPDGIDGELDLLLKVYKTIEEKEPTLLEKMIPVVSRYMKRYFQEKKYEQFYPVLDRFQRRFPAVVVSLLAHACDMVMFDILPSQYKDFVAMLKQMKQRMELINRQDDWTDFFVAFKKKHIGKKKLIQMVNLIGDSVWSVEKLMQHTQLPRVKPETSKSEEEESGSTQKKKRKRKDEEDTQPSTATPSSNTTFKKAKKKSKKKKAVESETDD
eukprot:TRINITY_DN4694_c0_g1_i8.p1 TRINITY_DN4694_c0_g1~~TRINITY_DN4694_c0_g1_i8.p1  ORF type:complete len:1563 (+),score=531.43 TRINITY_DN4694_c0_g1_i8:56-4744(+)